MIGIGPFTHGCAAQVTASQGRGLGAARSPSRQARGAQSPSPRPLPAGTRRDRAPPLRLEFAAVARPCSGSSGRQARDRRRRRSGGEPARWSGRGVAAPRLLHRGLAGTPRAGRPQAPAASSSRARRRAHGPVTPASAPSPTGDSGPWLSSHPSPPLSPPLRHPNPALPPASSSADGLVCHGQDPWRRLTLRPRGTRPPPLALRLLLPGQRAGHLSCEVCASSGEFPIPQVRLQVYLVLLIQYWWILITLNCPQRCFRPVIIISHTHSTLFLTADYISHMCFATSTL